MKFWAFALLPLLLTGCDPGRPISQPPPMIQAPPPPMADVSVDPLGGGADSSGGSALPGGSPSPEGSGGAVGVPVVPDPMRSSADSAASPPDPLLASGDPLKGPSMPTQHSHWLRGQVQDAAVIVLLNGVRQGSYRGVVDRDITMKLRPGLNFVTFDYQPKSANSSAQMEIVESEHMPPIAPLATFRSRPPVYDPVQSLPPVKQTYSFIAK